MQIFDITVPASGAFQVNAAGRYIKYLSGNNGGGDTTLTVTPGAKGGSKITLKPGQAYRISDAAPTPSSWTLANYAGGATILGQVVIGDGRIDDNTFSGVVQTVDGGKARSLAGNAFGVVGYSPAVSGQYSRVQLWNPAGSNTRLVVEYFSLVSSGGPANGGFMQFTNTQLATLASNGISKLSGGAGGVGKCYMDSTAAPPSTSGESSMIVNSATAYQVRLSEPVIITPGWGFMMWGGTLNAVSQMNFEWYEEPNV